MENTETTSMEEIVDSTARPEKITEKELNKLQITIRTVDRLTADVGRIEVQKFNLLNMMKKSNEEVNEHRAKFQDKYGTDNINIQTGVIAYPPEEDENQTPNSEENPTQNIQENGETDKED